MNRIRNYGTDMLLAGWFHDIIYDNKPDKELRSAEYFRDISDTLGVEYSLQRKVIDLILCTQDHKVKMSNLQKTSLIIRADLDGFRDIRVAEVNSHKLKKEFLYLYGITPQEWATNTKKFLIGLSNTIRYNKECDPSHLQEWEEIENGIKNTINTI